MTEIERLELELKRHLIDHLKLEDLTVEDIASDAPLFGDGLGLDSIDALEIGVLLQKVYGIRFREDTQSNEQHFYSIGTLARFVKDNVNS